MKDRKEILEEFKKFKKLEEKLFLRDFLVRSLGQFSVSELSHSVFGVNTIK